MAYSYTEVTATGSAQLIAVPEYIDQTHIKVSVNGVDTTSFSWTNSNTVSVTALVGTTIRVYRSTSPAARMVDYLDGSSVTEAVLDNDSKQAFFLAQEHLDKAAEILGLDADLTTALGQAQTYSINAGTSATNAATSATNAATSATTATTAAAAFKALSSVAGTNTVTASATGLAAYAGLQLVTFVPAVTNTGAVTLNINGLGAVSIVKQGSTALAAGDLVAGKGALLEYDGTQFQLVNPVTLTALGQFASSLAASGYQKLPTGLILQWGTATSSGTADVAVTFPTAYTSACYAVTATILSSVTGWATAVNALGTTGFNLGAWSNSSTRGAGATVYWVAVGK